MKNLAAPALFAAALFIAASANAQTWSFHYTGTTADLLDIHFPTETTGYVSTNFGVRKTTDAGGAWTSGGLSSGSYSGVFFVNKDTGWMVGDAGDIRKTTNGGTAWTNQTGTGGGTLFLRSVFFVNAELGFATRGASASGNGRIIRTTNGGTSWAPVDLGGQATSQSRKVFFTSASIGYSVGYAGYLINEPTVRKSTDSGATWTLASTGIPSALNLSAIEFVSPDTGYVGGDSGKIFKTVNAGATWTTVLSDSTSGVNVSDIECLNALACYASATGNGTVGGMAGGHIYKTTDGGVSWTRNLYLGTSPFYALAFPTASVGFVTGGGGTIRKTDAVAAISPAAHAGRTAFLRVSPADAGWNVAFTLDRSETVRATVRDLAGKSVWSTEFRAGAGSHTLALPAERWAPGVHLLDFRAGTARESLKIGIR